jgi:hypothetical protein
MDLRSQTPYFWDKEAGCLEFRVEVEEEVEEVGLWEDFEVVGFESKRPAQMLLTLLKNFSSLVLCLGLAERGEGDWEGD